MFLGWWLGGFSLGVGLLLALLVLGVELVSALRGRRIPGRSMTLKTEFVGFIKQNSRTPRPLATVSGREKNPPH